MPRMTKTKGAGALSKMISPAKPSPPRTAAPKSASRIANLGAWAHPPKGRKAK